MKQTFKTVLPGIFNTFRLEFVTFKVKCSKQSANVFLILLKTLYVYLLPKILSKKVLPSFKKIKIHKNKNINLAEFVHCKCLI